MKSFQESISQNRTLSVTEGKEKEDEEPQREIGFFEGANFLGAIVKKLKEKKKKKNNTVEKMLRKERKRSAMHENA